MEYRVSMKLTFNTSVVVDATSEEEAVELAKQMELVDDGMGAAELVDWEVRSRAVACQ